MNRCYLLLCALVLLMVCSCKNNRENTSQAEFSAVGGDRDAHGCIGSAGYTWSAVQERCIRLFEQGEPLLPVKESEGGSAILAAYAVFSPDSSRVELFLPESEDAPVAERFRSVSGGWCWEAVSDRGAYSLSRDTAVRWILEYQSDEQRRDTLYRSRL